MKTKKTGEKIIRSIDFRSFNVKERRERRFAQRHKWVHVLFAHLLADGVMTLWHKVESAFLSPDRFERGFWVLVRHKDCLLNGASDQVGRCVAYAPPDSIPAADQLFLRRAVPEGPLLGIKWHYAGDHSEMNHADQHFDQVFSLKVGGEHVCKELGSYWFFLSFIHFLFWSLRKATREKVGPICSHSTRVFRVAAEARAV